MADSLFGGLTSIGDKFNELANVEFLNLDAMLEEQEKQEALDEFEDEEFDEIEQMLVTEDSNAQYQEPQKYDDSAQQEEVARNESGMTTGQGMALPRSSVAAEESQWDWTETEENSKTKTQSLPETSSDIQEGSNISHVPDSSLVGGPSDSAHSTSDPEPKLIPSAQSLQKAPLDAANLTQLVRPALCSTAGAAIVAKGASSPSRNTGVMKIRKTSAGPGGDPSMHGDGGNVRSQKETMVIIGGTDTEVNMADNLRASVAAARGAGRAARKKKKKKKKNRGSLDFWGIESGIESASQELSAVMDRATASVDSNSGETPQASSERAAAAADPSSSSSMPFLASKEPKLKTLSDRMASGSLVAGVLASLQATTSTFFDDDAEEDVENDSVAKQVKHRRIGESLGNQPLSPVDSARRALFSRHQQPNAWREEMARVDELKARLASANRVGERMGLLSDPEHGLGFGLGGLRSGAGGRLLSDDFSGARVGADSATRGAAENSNMDSEENEGAGLGYLAVLWAVLSASAEWTAGFVCALVSLVAELRRGGGVLREGIALAGEEEEGAGGEGGGSTTRSRRLRARVCVFETCDFVTSAHGMSVLSGVFMLMVYWHVRSDGTNIDT